MTIVEKKIYSGGKRSWYFVYWKTLQWRCDVSWNTSIHTGCSMLSIYSILPIHGCWQKTNSFCHDKQAYVQIQIHRYTYTQRASYQQCICEALTCARIKKYFPLAKSINWTDDVESVCVCESVCVHRHKMKRACVMQHVASVTVNLKKNEICTKNAIDSIIISILSEPKPPPPHIGVPIWLNLFCPDAVHLGVYTYAYRKQTKNWKIWADSWSGKKIGRTHTHIYSQHAAFHPLIRSHKLNFNAMLLNVIPQWAYVKDKCTFIFMCSSF